MLPNNQLLTRAMFSATLNAIFQNLNMHPNNFNTHSFRIGTATSAKQAGISTSHIKSEEAMPTLNMYACHLKTYLSYQNKPMRGQKVICMPFYGLMHPSSENVTPLNLNNQKVCTNHQTYNPSLPIKPNPDIH